MNSYVINPVSLIPRSSHPLHGSLAACPAGRKRLSLLAAAVRHLFAPVIREAYTIATAVAAESAPPLSQPSQAFSTAGGAP
jgi:hypothetical protein